MSKPNTTFNPDEWEPHVHRSEVTGQPTGKIELRRKEMQEGQAEKKLTGKKGLLGRLSEVLHETAAEVLRAWGFEEVRDLDD